MATMMRHRARSVHGREAHHAAGMPLDWNLLIVVLRRLPPGDCVGSRLIRGYMMETGNRFRRANSNCFRNKSGDISATHRVCLSVLQVVMYEQG